MMTAQITICIVFVYMLVHTCCSVFFALQVREKLAQLATERGGIMEKWEDRWDYLQLSEFCLLLSFLVSQQASKSLLSWT